MKPFVKALGGTALLATLFVMSSTTWALDVVINQVGTSWQPATVTITPGDQVTWVRSSGIHTTTSGTGPSDPDVGVLWDESLNAGATSFAFTFPATGTFPFFCRPHFLVGMTGVVTVEDDDDGDGIPNSTDNCPATFNTSQDDADGDLIGDECDTCTDTDGDGFGNPGFAANTCPDDNCPAVFNPSQDDTDADGSGDECDTCTDTDGDGFGNPGFAANTCDVDNCPVDFNPGQEDADSNGVGDACDVIVECDCPNQGDMNADSVPDAVDLNLLIDALFFGGPNPTDIFCGTTRGDLNADGVPDAVDLNYMIAHLFFGGPVPIDPCP